jgi:N-methylhydantoinase B
MTGGGGGFGDPRERDADLMRTDLLDGHVTAAAVRETYGVDLGADRSHGSR